MSITSKRNIFLGVATITLAVILCAGWLTITRLVAQPKSQSDLENPFSFMKSKSEKPAEAHPPIQATKQTAVIPKPVALVLNGIFQGTTERYAIVNQHVLRKGDTVLGWEVAAIEINQVILKRGSEKQILSVR